MFWVVNRRFGVIFGRFGVFWGGLGCFHGPSRYVQYADSYTMQICTLGSSRPVVYKEYYLKCI